MRMDRRRFIQILAGAVIGAGVNGYVLKGRATSPYGRPEDAYMPEYLPLEMQPAQKNPYLPPGVQQTRTCQDFIERRQVPGIEYTVNKKPVRAVAGGIVHFIGEVKDARRASRGHYVRVAHDRYDRLRKPLYPRITLYRHQAYRSSYYYLSSLAVQHWQSVKRGQILGYAARAAHGNPAAFKLVLEERTNPVNPDDFGLKHSFMQHSAGNGPRAITLEDMHRRLEGQIDILRRMDNALKGRDGLSVFKKIHCYTRTEKFDNFPVKWSTVEQFRFLSRLYEKNPGLFPSVSESQHRQMRKQFYRLQPILLTLPFE